jgi:uncharacterized protein (TIGR03083 family)
MTRRTFADWVAPVARQLAEDSAELVAFARAQPPEFWDRASAVEGWTNRDVLAHTGGGNDQLLQIALRAAIAWKPLGPEAWAVDTDAANERGVKERRSWPIERVIAEIEEGADETQELLSQLADDHRGVRNGSSITLEQFLRIVQAERHDHEHLQQLRGA